MKSITSDARRYAWCRGYALWIVGMAAQGFFEDVRGALHADQEGLLRHVARELGGSCAVAIALFDGEARPLPAPAARAPWAFEQLAAHELRSPCWDLYCGVEEETAEEIAERCEDLLARTRAIVGEVPDVLTPRGYFPAIARAREWLKLIDAVGEENFLPASWTAQI